MSKNMFTINRSLASLKQSSKFASVAARQQSVWTQDKIIQSPYKSVDTPNCTLHEYVWKDIDKWPQRTVAVCASTGRSYTYEQAFKLTRNFAANLRSKLNIQNGDVCAIMLPNMPDFPIAAMGILEAGGIITTINPIYTAHEVQRQLLMSKAKVIVTLPDVLKTVKDALIIAKLRIPIVVIKTNEDSTPDGTICFRELCQDVHVDMSVLKKVRINPNDICFLPYSSGTTGLPKGVELTHKNIMVNGEQVNEEAIVCHNPTTASHQDAVLAVLPFFHIYAASVIMFHKMSLGIKLVTLAKLQPDHYFETIENHKTNVLFVAPPLVLMMGSHKAATSKTLAPIEILVNGAAPLSTSDVDRFFERAQKTLDFRQGYGLTETSPTISLTPKGWTKDYNVTGPPIPNTELRIVDQDFKNLGPNETGEILIRGPQVMRGYRDNPQATKETIIADGWFRSGDLGVVDEAGFLTVADRLKELIKVKGYQVPPAELEAVLREHPSVIDAAVVGVPHPTNGEAPKAFIVLRKDKPCDPKVIADFVKERVAPYKRVTDITILDAVPKSPSGKILRRILKEKYC